ncbi:CdaR family protein [Psychroserpens ponticola]|uniref:CdaR family protein n=1 Tax=Psychroserpens ponticola TaxID=2932268 RepID=A0ABY7RTS8_9FLAO|nr:CdaR family protein [Psychroserpens ponticola]WCO00506.1 CdaR family protein [Psychroserpens ponticola]
MAFLILVLSKLSKSYTETLTVAVNYINLPEDKILTNNEDPEVKISVNTYGFNLFASYFYDNTIAIDIENDTYINKGTYVWVANRALTNIETQLGKNFKIESIKPDTLSFSFGTLSVKKVPVILNSNLSFASGYDSLKKIVLVPDSIKIIGSDSEIKTIDHVETFELRLLDIKENINTTISLKVPEEGHTFKLSQEKIRITADVEKFTEGTLEIPVVINNLPSDIQINYFPKTIKVSYEVSLNEYKSIKTSDFKIECDYLEIKTSNKSYFIPKFVKIPDNVKRVKMKQNKIEYIITE